MRYGAGDNSQGGNASPASPQVTKVVFTAYLCKGPRRPAKIMKTAAATCRTPSEASKRGWRTEVRVRLWPPPPTPESLTKDVYLQPGLEWELLLRRTWSGQNWSHCNSQDFLSLSSKNQLSFLRTHFPHPEYLKTLSTQIYEWGVLSSLILDPSRRANTKTILSS